MNASSLEPNPFGKRFAGRNSLKIRALEAFENRGWLNPPLWAALVGFYSMRASYSYLLRLHRFGLLQRGRTAQGLLFYRISERGTARLMWLRRFRKSTTTKQSQKGGATGKQT